MQCVRLQSAIRSMHNRWIMRRRKSERREVRQLCELVAARLAGAGQSPRARLHARRVLTSNPGFQQYGITRMKREVLECCQGSPCAFVAQLFAACGCLCDKLGATWQMQFTLLFFDGQFSSQLLVLARVQHGNNVQAWGHRRSLRSRLRAVRMRRAWMSRRRCASLCRSSATTAAAAQPALTQPPAHFPW